MCVLLDDSLVHVYWIFIYVAPLLQNISSTHFIVVVLYDFRLTRSKKYKVYMYVCTRLIRKNVCTCIRKYYLDLVGTFLATSLVKWEMYLNYIIYKVRGWFEFHLHFIFVWLIQIMNWYYYYFSKYQPSFKKQLSHPAGSFRIHVEKILLLDDIANFAPHSSH